MFVQFDFRLGYSQAKKVIANVRALVEVMDALKGDADPQGVGRLIMEEVVICSPFPLSPIIS